MATRRPVENMFSCAESVRAWSLRLAVRWQAAVVEHCEEDQGELIGDMEKEADKGAGKEELWFGDGRSTTTSESESSRVRIAKYTQTWGHLILGTEELLVRRFHRRIRASTLLLVPNAPGLPRLRHWTARI